MNPLYFRSVRSIFSRANPSFGWPRRRRQLRSFCQAVRFRESQIPIPRSSFPAFVAFGFVGFWACRHRILYTRQVQKSGKKNEQTVLSAQFETSSSPRPHRVVLLVALLAISGHITWLSTLRTPSNSWVELKRIIDAPFKCGVSFGFRCVSLAYFHASILVLLLQLYSDIAHPDQRKQVDPNKNAIAESIANYVLETTNVFISFFGSTFIFLYAGGAVGGTAFMMLNRRHWMMQLNSLPVNLKTFMGI